VNTQQSHVHHYVPRWYQRRFLASGKSKFHYLDLHPEVITSNKVSHQRKALLHWGPARCFYKDDLYTLKLGGWSSDQIEQRFFGAVDSLGRKAVELFANYNGFGDAAAQAFRSLVPYMDAQRSRTPRGLDWFKKQVGLRNHSQALMVMQRLFQLHTTMWAEGVWEIARAGLSPTKFIVTDEPVTFFNRRLFPSEYVYPGQFELELVGTRTLFPLGLESCLIITHLQLARNPRTNPTATRVNARAYETVMTSMLDIQFGRELEEDEVLRINYILKRRATRYIAAAEEEWLYPESRVSTANWSKLDNDWFLFPHLWKVPFHSETVVGYRDGSAWSADEYGRHPGNPNASTC
jgi:Protein of unknown function (DUF4238)